MANPVVSRYFTDNILADTSGEVATFDYTVQPMRYITFCNEFAKLMYEGIKLGVLCTLSAARQGNTLILKPNFRTTYKYPRNKNIQDTVTIILDDLEIDPTNMIFPVGNLKFVDLVVLVSAVSDNISFASEIEGEENNMFLRLHMMYDLPFTPSNVFDAIKRQIGVIEEVIPKRPKTVSELKFITDTQKTQFMRMLESAGDNTEIEFSLGSFSSDNKFSPGVDKISFDRILEGLSADKQYKAHKAHKTTVSIHGITRSIKKGKSTTYQEKRRNFKDNINNTDFGWRIAESTETPLDSKPPGFEPTLVRKRTRRSFTSKDKKYVVELTEVESGDDMTYEVEIEFKTPGADVKTLIKGMEKVYLLYRDVDSFENLMDAAANNEAVTEHNKLFNMDIQRRKMKVAADKLYSGYWNKPVNLKLHDLLDYKNKFALTVKLNGERRMLFISRSGTYLVNAPLTITRIGEGSGSLSGTLIDGELIELNGMESFYAFDVLFVRGIDVRRTLFAKRYEQLTNIMRLKKEQMGDVKYIIKQFYTHDLYPDTTKVYQKMLELEKANKNSTDGIIYQSQGPYYNRNTFKWKPASKLTIDFKLAGTGNKYTLLTLQKKKMVPFNIRGSSQTITVGGKPGEMNGKICECVWSAKKREWSIVRERTDRDQPNYYETAADVWKDIINPISEVTICGDDLVLMRKYHNTIKEALIKRELNTNMDALIKRKLKAMKGVDELTAKELDGVKKELKKEYAAEKGDVVVDLGTGRGGDIGKYANAGVKIVFAVEPNDQNSAEMKRRLGYMRGMKMEVVHINAKGQDTDTIRKATKAAKTNVLASFFSLTFFFKDSESYGKLLQTIGKLVPKGGKFLGICFDGQRVKQLLKKSDGTFDGHVYNGSNPDPFTITSKTADLEEDRLGFGETIEININDPTSMVKKQTEWLVDFERLRADLQSMGFRQTKNEFLDNGLVYNILPTGAQQFSDLNRLFVFKRSTKEDDPDEKDDSDVLDIVVESPSGRIVDEVDESEEREASDEEEEDEDLY